MSDPVGGTDSLADSFQFVCRGQPREEGRKEMIGHPQLERERVCVCVCLVFVESWKTPFPKIGPAMTSV